MDIILNSYIIFLFHDLQLQLLNQVKYKLGLMDNAMR
jgi:hypothetical protein